MLLKEHRCFLRPEDEKSNCYIPFDVPEGVDKLCITYSYRPKILEDKEKSYKLIKENLIRDAGEDFIEYGNYDEFMPLKNLVTLSLLSPEGYMGAAHRQDDSQYHEISKAFASPGFIKGEISAGQWVLCLNVHALVTEECFCDIRLDGEVSE